MIHRLLQVIILTASVLAAGCIGLALLIGKQNPAGEQVAVLLPSYPRWTKVELVEVDRRLAASRFLPIRARQAEWVDHSESEASNRLIVYGRRAGQERVYALNYDVNPDTSDVTRIDLLNNGYSGYGYNPTGISPDLRWMVIPGVNFDQDPSDVTLKALGGQQITFDQIATLVNVPGMYFQWSQNSSSLLFSTGTNPPAYYIMDAASGEKDLIRSDQIFDLMFTPDGRHLFYSVNSEPKIQGTEAAAAIETYYVYDLATHSSQPVLTGPLYQWIWSPDGTKLAYLRPLIEPEQAALFSPPGTPPSQGISGAPDSLYGGVNGISFYIRFAGNSYLGSAPVNISLNYYDVLVQPGVLDVVTGRNTLIGDPRKDYASITWLPGSQGVLLNLSQNALMSAASQGGRLSRPEDALVYARLDDPARTSDQPLPVYPFNYEGESLSVVKPLPTVGDHLLLMTTSTTSPPVYYLADTRSGVVQPLQLPVSEALNATTWSPDGQQVILTTIITGTTQPYTFVPYIAPRPGSQPTVPRIFPTLTPTGIATLSLQISPSTYTAGNYHNYLLRMGENEDSSDLIPLKTSEPAAWLHWSADQQQLLSYRVNPKGMLQILVTDLTHPELEPQIHAQFSVSARLIRAYATSEGLIQWRPNGGG